MVFFWGGGANEMYSLQKNGTSTHGRGLQSMGLQIYMIWHLPCEKPRLLIKMSHKYSPLLAHLHCNLVTMYLCNLNRNYSAFFTSLVFWQVRNTFCLDWYQNSPLIFEAGVTCIPDAERSCKARTSCSTQGHY